MVHNAINWMSEFPVRNFQIYNNNVLDNTVADKTQIKYEIKPIYQPKEMRK
jgi:hypothetical protein